MVAQAVDRDGLPVDLPCTQVFMSSSAPHIAAVADSIPHSWATPAQLLTVPIVPSGVPGSTIITVGSSGLTPGTATLPFRGLVPSKLLLERGPFIPSSFDAMSAVLSISLTDDGGKPVLAHAPLRVVLAGAGPGFPDAVDLPPGAGHVQAPWKGGTVIKDMVIAGVSGNPISNSLSISVRTSPLDLSLEIPKLAALLGSPASVTATDNRPQPSLMGPAPQHCR